MGVLVGRVPVAVKVLVLVKVGVPEGVGDKVGVLVGVLVQVLVTVGVGGDGRRMICMALTWEVSAVELKTMSNRPVETTQVVGMS